jgi:hypothetical protein
LAGEMLLMRAALIPAFAAVMLAGCGPSPEEKAAAEAAAKKAAAEKADAAIIEPIKQEVADTLRDPSSAQFRRLFVRRLDIKADAAKGRTQWSFTVVCGEVNGKNGYGGYDGFKPFYRPVHERINGKDWDAFGSKLSPDPVVLIQDYSPDPYLNDLNEKILKNKTEHYKLFCIDPLDEF